MFRVTHWAVLGKESAWIGGQQEHRKVPSLVKHCHGTWEGWSLVNHGAMDPSPPPE